MFHRITFLLSIVGSLYCNFNRCAVCFQSFMTIPSRSTQSAARIKRFLRLHIVIKPLNKKVNITNPLLSWSVTLLMFFPTLRLQLALQIWRLSKGRTDCPYIGDFGIFFLMVPPKAHDWSSWTLTECYLSWKIVKYCILSEVCMINSIVSPRM